MPRPRKHLPNSIHVKRRLPGWSALLAVSLVIATVALRTGTKDRSSRNVSVSVPTSDADFKRYHNKVFRVVRVVDGDTLDIDAPDGAKSTTRIRLWGVDTPEIAHGGGDDMHYGPEAARFARDTLDGRMIHLVLSPLDTRGKYGRLLAYILLERGGVMFNETLIEEGFAYADSRFAHHYKDQYKRTEKRARRAGVGLWAEVTPEQMPAWRRRMER